MKALMREKALLKSSTISPPDPITAEDIVADMQARANPGQGGQTDSQGNWYRTY